MNTTIQNVQNTAYIYVGIKEKWDTIGVQNSLNKQIPSRRSKLHFEVERSNSLLIQIKFDHYV